MVFHTDGWGAGVLLTPLMPGLKRLKLEDLEFSKHGYIERPHLKNEGNMVVHAWDPSD